MSKLLRLLFVSLCVVLFPLWVQGKPRAPLHKAPPVAPVPVVPPPVSVAPAPPSPPPPTVPPGPVVLWGVQRGCEVDAELSQALRLQLEGMGATIQELAFDSGLARACVGPECLDLLRKSCAAPLPAQGSVIGGHLAVQETGAMLLASLRLFRTDFAAGRAVRSFYRYDYVEKACSGASCGAALREAQQALLLQLLSDEHPSSDLPAVVHSAVPPYCIGHDDMRQFLCKPLPIRSTCVSFDSGRDMRLAVRCPFGQQAVALPVKPACNCQDVTGCTLAERQACGAVRGPLLRRVVGGSLLAAGGAFLLSAALLTINDTRAAVLSRSVSCSYGGIEPEPCQSLAGSLPTTWVMGIGLVGGGVAVLLDPLRLFRDRPAPQPPAKEPASP